MHLLISVFSVGVKGGGGRPRSQQEGPARAAECPQGRRSSARGRSLLTRGGGRNDGSGPHFLAPLSGLPSAAIVATGGVGGAFNASCLLTIQ